MDGTFVGQDHIVHPKNIEMVKKLKEKGIKFIVATGRPTPGALRLINSLKLLDYVDYFITYNGLEIWDVKKDEKIASGMLTLEQIHEAMDATKSFDTEYLVVEDGRVRTTLITKYTALEGEINHLEMWEKDFTSDMLPFYPKLICAAHEDVVREMDNHLKQGNYSFDFVISHKNFFEIMNMGVSKGAAVKVVCDRENICLAETVGLGDNNNDETLMTGTGIGIAMFNATDHLKSLAKIRSKYFAHEGAFAIELEKII